VRPALPRAVTGNYFFLSQGGVKGRDSRKVTSWEKNGVQLKNGREKENKQGREKKSAERAASGLKVNAGYVGQYVHQKERKGQTDAFTKKKNRRNDEKSGRRPIEQ